MSREAAVPGAKISSEQLQMICCRYYTAAQYAQGKQVLEVGCGAGLGLGYLSRIARKVIGGDYSEANLRYAHQHYGERVGLLLLDAQRLPFKDSSFDVVVAMEVIQYFTRLDDFFKECYRILRKKGVLLLCLPNQDMPGFHKSPLSHRYYSAPELFALLNRRHFDAELFGAYPISRGPTWERVRAAIIVTAGKILDVTPKGKEAKEFLNRVILGKTIVVKPELADSDMIAQNFKLIPIPSDSPDYRHEVLYAITHIR
ncbi:Ubiquinone biosynthesis O-methyltransferase [subsurface metagenome]